MCSSDLVRGDDGWGRQELLAADDHGFGWAAPSQEPADDGRYGLLTGRHQAAEGEGVLYHVAY